MKSIKNMLAGIAVLLCFIIFNMPGSANWTLVFAMIGIGLVIFGYCQKDRGSKD